MKKYYVVELIESNVNQVWEFNDIYSARYKMIEEFLKFEYQDIKKECILRGKTFDFTKHFYDPMIDIICEGGEFSINRYCCNDFDNYREYQICVMNV